MSRFIVTLTEEQRANMEAWRVKLGLRSHAEVVRHWADSPVRDYAPSATATVTNREPKPVKSHGKLIASNETVTFGPVRSPPGSRLKKRP